MAKTEQLCACSRFAPITEAAALAAADWVGRGEGLAADQAAREAMSASLAGLGSQARVVAGRMAQGLSEHMQPGQTVGGSGTQRPPTHPGAAQAGPDAGGTSSQAGGSAGAGTAEAGAAGEAETVVTWDLAVAALEGHKALARGLDGALAMLAAGPPGSIMAVPEMYMQKMVVPGQAAEAIDMNAPVAENIRRLGDALGRDPRELTVVVLDRPRHEELIEEIKDSGARLKLIEDGDVSASLAAAIPDTGIDMCIGIGGSTEGIITAAGLRCLGGAMQARFWPVSRHQVDKVRALGIDDIEAVLKTEDMAGAGALLSVTAITTGRFLRAVERRADGIRTETITMCSQCHKISLVKTIHRQDEKQPTPSLWML